MGSQGPIRVVHFKEPGDFIEATKPHDDSFMNFAIGSLMDSMDDRQAIAQARWGEKTRTLLGVYRGEELLVTLTKIAKDFSWVISTPRDAKRPLQEGEMPHALHLLAVQLSAVIDPKSFDKLIGPETYVDAFLTVWISHMGQNGWNLKLLDPYFRSKASYATLRTIPEPSPASDVHRVSRAEGPEDVEALAHLYIEFTSHGPIPSQLGEARAVMGDGVQSQSIWVCKTNEDILGYILVGRATARTIAIRNVFVRPSHRRKGIAEALVRAVTRYYLGAVLLDFEGSPPSGETKEEVCLNVADEGAERLYKRTGFLFDVDDPATGKAGWYRSSWRGVELVDT